MSASRAFDNNALADAFSMARSRCLDHVFEVTKKFVVPRAVSWMLVSLIKESAKAPLLRSFVKFARARERIVSE